MRAHVACAWMVVLAGMLAQTAQASAAPMRFVLQPGPAEVQFRAYGLGVMPINGAFARFDGVLSLDDANPTACQVALRAEAGSLRMPQQDMTDDALGPDLMDVAHFPDFRFDGRCDGDAVQGMLELHGVSHPVRLQVTLDNGRWVASGLIRRADWGMGARPLLAGPQVRISIAAELPKGFAAAMSAPH